ncbi:unnamed protein product [Caenorhabditis brenneri]
MISYLQLSTTSISVFLNIFLIWLIATKSPKKLGNYKYLMIYTAIFDIYYTLLGFVSKAAIFSHGYSILVYRIYDESFWFDRYFSMLLINAYCFTFGMSMACLAIHFVYRYGVTCGVNSKKLTSGWRFKMMFFAPGFYGFWWASVVLYGCMPDRDTDDYFRFRFLDTFDLKLENVTYVILKFYKLENGVLNFHLPAWIVAGNMYLMVGISEFCVLFLGVKCYSNISKQLSVTSGTSKFSANLQKQLFNALVIQTIVPVVSMYLPIFVFFFCPMLSLNMGYSSRFISDCISWYPAINSLPSMIVVKNYRRAIMDLSHYEIDEMDRFDWYETQWRMQLNNRPPKYEGLISLLRAYEFDVEYSISTTTWGIGDSVVYCRYFDINGSEILPAFQSYSFPEYVVNCEKRPGTKRVSISTEEFNNYTDPIQLVDRTKKGYKYEFSFCMAPIYGQEPKWLLISEIIEHYKLQGVTHFYIYVFHITEYDNAILQDYVRTGEVDVTFLLERDDRETFYWQHVAYRDCTLRSRHESKWSLVADIDERLLMTKYPGTILDYLRSIKDEKIGAVQFRQQWVLKTETMPEKYEGEKQIDTWSPTLRWHNSSAYGPLGHTAKCIIMAEKVFSMGTHYPKIYFPGFELYYLTTDEGIVRHYRDQKMWDWGERYLEETLSFGELRLTDYPEKYQKNLTDAVKRRTKYVYENYHVRDN